MELKQMDNRQLVTELIRKDSERAQLVKEVAEYKNEIMGRGAIFMDNTNTRFAKYYGNNGSCAVTDAETLTIGDDLRLKKLLPEGVYEKFVKVTPTVKYEYDKKLEQALKAIFKGEYSFEMTLDEYLSDPGLFPHEVDAKQKKVLLRKLSGEYIKDRKLLESMFGKDTYEEELLYIYRIKNGELIRVFLPDEGLDAQIEEIRKCMIVEVSTKITIDASDVEEE